MASPRGAEGGMASARSRFLLAAAAVLGGLLAGLDVDRTLVAMPAWQAVGPTAWAEFSRHADLGKGLFLYPLEAIGTFLLLMAAATSLRRRARAGPACPGSCGPRSSPRQPAC